ncbi:MAG TPA: HAD family phosphatase [archaeon]|nr:HAD family phosphatase [archaeon]
MTTKAFVFDWGDVIALMDTPGFAKTIAERHGIKPDKFHTIELGHRIKNNSGKMTDLQYIEALNRDLGLKLDKKEFFKEFLEGFVKINSELVEIIKKLKNNYKILLLTNNNEGFMKYIKKVEFSHLFDKIYNSYDHKMAKPDPKFFNKVLKDAKLNADECIFVDDNERNIKAARQLGFHVVHYKSFEDFVVRIAAMGIKLK